MWECRYAREPVDFKLLWLHIKKKIWVFPLSMLLGALIVLGCHYTSRVIAQGGRTYEATSVFYIDYAIQETGAQYEWLNYYTWNEVIRADYFMDNLYDALAGKYTKDELSDFITATVESDIRYLYVRVTTHNAEQSLEIAKAFEPIVTEFADIQKEFNKITVSDRVDSYRDSSKLKVKNALILGAVFGFIASVLAVLGLEIINTAIYVPATMERRYSIPTLGCECMSEYETNCEYFLGKAEKLAYISVDEENVIPDFKVSAKAALVENALARKDLPEILSACDAVVVGVKAGVRNDKALERVLEELCRLNISITATILTGEDKKLINSYYRWS